MRSVSLFRCWKYCLLTIALLCTIIVFVIPQFNLDFNAVNNYGRELAARMQGILHTTPGGNTTSTTNQALDLSSSSRPQALSAKYITRVLPNAMIKPELRIVNYDDFPYDKSIECVPMKSAEHKENICIYNSITDVHISYKLKVSGYWEANIVRTVRSLLVKCPECQFIDIGSNIGVYAISIASMNRNVIAVEPQHDNLLRLTKSIRLNHFQNRIILISNPISDTYENITIWRPKGNPGGSHSVRKADRASMDTKLFNKSFDEVPTIKMDDILPLVQFKRAIMKIDIEGYEPRAFSFASKLFEQVRFHYVFMEWGWKSSNRKNRDENQFLVNFFVSRGFVACNNNLKRLTANNYTFNDTLRWPWDIVWVRKGT